MLFEQESAGVAIGGTALLQQTSINYMFFLPDCIDETHITCTEWFSNKCLIFSEKT